MSRDQTVNNCLKDADNALRRLERYSPQFEVVFQNEAVSAMRDMHTALKLLVERIEELEEAK